MHYTVSSQGNKHFEVVNEQGDSIGALDFNTWRFNKATITTVAGMVYDIAPTGFWQTTLAITKSDMPFAEIKAILGTGLRLSFANESRPFIFKKKGFWNSNFSVEDEEGQETAFIQVDYDWRKWKYTYEIDIRGNMYERENNLVLPLIILFCVRYTRMRQASSAT